MSRSPHRIVALVGDGLATFEFGLVAEVFALPRPELECELYEFGVASMDPGPLRANGGITVEVDGGLQALDNAETIVIPGWSPVEEPPPEVVLEALRTAHERGARLLSICSGAFVIAATGLLDGLAATTHWKYGKLLAEMYPNVRVDADVLYVDEGSLLTSAGSAAGIDACLHLVRKDFGADIAASVARRLVVQPHRSGGQRQFIDQAHPVRLDDSLTPVLEWAIENLDQELSIEILADYAATSPRTLSRRFDEQLGTSPYRWIITQRVIWAQQLLETTRLSVDDVAGQTGFASAATLRHHFSAALGLSPTTYRGHFAETANE